MKRLEMTSGGGGEDRPQFSKAQLSAKTNRLSRIRLALRHWQKGAPPPYVTNIVAFALLTLVSVSAIAAVASTFWFTDNPSVWVALAVVASVAAGFYANRLDDSARTHLEHLDRLLAAYEPVSKDAYRSLQEKVKDRGAVDGESLEWWLEAESAAIERAANWHLPSELRFIKKEV